MNIDETTPYEARQQGRQAYYDGGDLTVHDLFDGVRALELAWIAGWEDAESDAADFWKVAQ